MPSGLHEVDRRAARLPMQQQLHAAQTALDLADLGDGPHRIENSGRDIIDVLALRDGKNESRFALQRRFNCAERRGTARATGHRNARE